MESDFPPSASASVGGVTPVPGAPEKAKAGPSAVASRPGTVPARLLEAAATMLGAILAMASTALDAASGWAPAPVG
ncbi:hypothetical protein ACFPOI_03640 [Nonomuraea angiospora]|uniref:Uncharacterized protein n=1 Tax=Nonomuraea angiospora TaxID=46172 RepID=A0ABR9MC20_9ACTN|nr:hypothetical protein [Nonomuraea angiospora]MBE1590098.1 hypothetical protein [Nonomuraea angiospora]